MPILKLSSKQPEGRGQVYFVHYCVPSTEPIPEPDISLTNALVK